MILKIVCFLPLSLMGGGDEWSTLFLFVKTVEMHGNLILKKVDIIKPPIRNKVKISENIPER